MRKFRNPKAGFTLIEMVLVIALIVVLAAVLFISITQYLSKADTVKYVASHVASSFSAQNVSINSNFISLGY
jgi:type IV pilus assembly protein PilA